MKRIPQPFGRKVWGYRSSDEEIQGSVWHFPFPSVEESKTTAGRTRHRNRYIDGNKPSRPLRIAAKSAVEESGSFLEQDSTEVPKFALRLFLPLRESCWGVPSPNPAMRPVGRERRSQTMRKKYNTPHRRHVVKTRMTDEEYADFTGRLAAYEISQSEFIRQAIRKATIRPLSLIHI